MTVTLSEKEIGAFETDGVIVLRGIVTSRWLDPIASAIDRDIAEPGPFVHGYDTEDARGKFHRNLRIWENDPECNDFCLNSDFLALAAQLMRSDRVNLLYDQLFVKESDTPNPTRWHNDQLY